jgi:hypothetical protein
VLHEQLLFSDLRWNRLLFSELAWNIPAIDEHFSANCAHFISELWWNSQDVVLCHLTDGFVDFLKLCFLFLTPKLCFSLLVNKR